MAWPLATWAYAGCHFGNVENGIKLNSKCVETAKMDKSYFKINGGRAPGQRPTQYKQGQMPWAGVAAKISKCGGTVAPDRRANSTKRESM